MSKIQEMRKGYNMCKALEDMKECSRQERIQEGIRIFIREKLDEGTPQERIIEKLKKYFSLPEKESLQHIMQVAS